MCHKAEPEKIEIPIGSITPYPIKYWGKYAIYGKEPILKVEVDQGSNIKQTTPLVSIDTISDTEGYIEKLILNLPPAIGGVTDKTYYLTIQ